MYSVGATYSTLPQESSGLSSASRRLPFSSREQKYSMGTAAHSVKGMEIRTKLEACSIQPFEG